MTFGECHTWSDWTMLQVPANLGQRIIELARIAAAMHLERLAPGDDSFLACEALGGAGNLHGLTDESQRFLPRFSRFEDESQR